MTTKIKNTLYLIGIGVLVSYIITLKFQNSSLLETNNELKEEKKKELKRIRDSSLVENKKHFEKFIEEKDSLINLKSKPKYIPYEKLLYIDRNLDSALDVLSNYTYKKTREKDSTTHKSR